jgi:hypothetical protein
VTPAAIAGNNIPTFVLEQPVSQIKAKAKLGDHELNDVPVLNPGDWFGKTWLLEIGGSYSSLYLVVEADSASDAIDELADNARYGHLLIVEEEYLDDYPEEDRHHSGSGHVLDLDHLAIHGAEGSAIPFPCRYYGDNLPDEGILPAELDEWDWNETPAEQSGDQS